jgi:hypothetical protein
MQYDESRLVQMLASNRRPVGQDRRAEMFQPAASIGMTADLGTWARPSGSKNVVAEHRGASGHIVVPSQE